MGKFICLITAALLVFFASILYINNAQAVDSGAASAVTPLVPTVVTPNVTNVFSDFKNHKWREAIAGAIVLIMFLWRRFGSIVLLDKLSSWWSGFFTVLLSLLGTLPEALAVPTFDWGNFVLNSLITSGEAMLLWQMVIKKIPGLAIPDKNVGGAGGSVVGKIEPK